jgi:hypothetical protein
LLIWSYRLWIGRAALRRGLRAIKRLRGAQVASYNSPNRASLLNRGRLECRRVHDAGGDEYEYGHDCRLVKIVRRDCICESAEPPVLESGFNVGRRFSSRTLHFAYSGLQVCRRFG